MRFTLTSASLALVAVANALPSTLIPRADPLLCSAGSCWDSPANATDHGCAQWAGGVDAWATCGFTGAVTCTTCSPCVQGGCYTSPNQADGTGCTQWDGGVDAWATCGFTGAITCTTCSA
ncbi:hypothetical protein C8R46DRAFT_1223553 [Mycena filopes]|nr:hypothetical protein C8R46DRAFT_1223553 [Mycena filopes]